MQDDDYISDEESEWKAEEEVESLIHGPSYGRVDCEDYRAKMSGIDAKRCWLKCVENNQPVPSNVITVLFKTIKNEVEVNERKHRKQAVKNKKSEKYRILAGNPDKDKLFELLHIAQTDLDSFWHLFHGDFGIFNGVDTGNKDILDMLRRWLPARKDFDVKEVYAIFYELYQGNDKPPPGPPYLYEDSFAQAFREWRDSNKK